MWDGRGGDQGEGVGCVMEGEVIRVRCDGRGGGQGEG